MYAHQAGRPYGDAGRVGYLPVGLPSPNPRPPCQKPPVQGKGGLVAIALQFLGLCCPCLAIEVFPGAFRNITFFRIFAFALHLLTVLVAILHFCSSVKREIDSHPGIWQSACHTLLYLSTYLPITDTDSLRVCVFSSLVSSSSCSCCSAPSSTSSALPSLLLLLLLRTYCCSSASL